MGLRTTSSAKARSVADWKRRSGSFSRQRTTICATPGGTEAGSGGGSWFRMAYPLSTSDAPGKARSPESSSWSIAPRLKISVRQSTASPRTCSGDMYPGVPSTEPVRVAAPPGVTVTSIIPWGPARTSSASLAIPKSSSFTWPPATMNALSGFTSRWTTPRRCAAARPRASWMPQSSAVASGTRPRSIRCRRDSPSQELGDEEGRAVVNPDVVNGHDVGVVERPGDPGLLLEAPHQVRAARQRLVHHLQGDLTAEPAIPRAVDLRHASDTDDREDLVGAEPVAGDQAHVTSDSSPQHARGPGVR